MTEDIEMSEKHDACLKKKLKQRRNDWRTVLHYSVAGCPETKSMLTERH